MLPIQTSFHIEALIKTDQMQENWQMPVYMVKPSKKWPKLTFFHNFCCTPPLSCKNDCLWLKSCQTPITLLCVCRNFSIKLFEKKLLKKILGVEIPPPLVLEGLKVNNRSYAFKLFVGESPHLHLQPCFRKQIKKW